MGTIKNTKGKRLNILWVIILIGSVPLLTAILILTIYSTRKMEQELEDSTYARLKACAVSVEKYFEWDVREDILCRDDVSYEFIDSLKKDNIELTFFEGDERYITSVVDENGNRPEEQRQMLQSGKLSRRARITTQMVYRLQAQITMYTTHRCIPMPVM